MQKSISDPIEAKTIELTNYIGKFDKNRFIPFFIFLLKADLGTKNRFLHLTSRVQQILYLLRLFLKDGNGSQGDLDCQNVENLLESIERLYKEKFSDDQIIEYYDYNYRKSLAIAGTYLNYFLNSSLVYEEQIIDRIQGTFSSLDSHIFQQTGLYVDDFIEFYLETIKISKSKFRNCYKIFSSQEINKLEDGITCYSENNTLFLPYSLPLNLAIFRSDYKRIDDDKLDKVFSYFSSYSGDCENNYYCSPNILWAKPFISLNKNEYYLPYNQQLILSIYYFLFQECEKKGKDTASIARSHFLERKTKCLFLNYFKNYKPKIFTNYYLESSNCEKDILVICKNIVLIIECKSKKYNEPLRRAELSFERIKWDFKSSIQDAYRQLKEVEELFFSKEEVIITDKMRNKIDVISTRKISQVFSIIVTQERFGQIQCDLGLLLDKDEKDYYPWSVSIDDLESILLTFSRKENPFAMLSTYLISREKLHERLICFDELDLAGYYLMQSINFIKECNSDQIFVSSPDICNVFDDLYQNGFGFDNELGLDEKIQLSIPSLITYELCKKLKLKVPANIREYKSKNGISDDSMRSFKKLLDPNNSSSKEFFEFIKNKSISYKNIPSKVHRQ